MAEANPSFTPSPEAPEDWLNLYEIAKSTGVEANQVEEAIDDVLVGINEVLAEGAQPGIAHEDAVIQLRKPGKKHPARYLDPMIGNMVITLLRDRTAGSLHTGSS